MAGRCNVDLEARRLCKTGLFLIRTADHLLHNDGKIAILDGKIAPAF
jgi:hypothetical protein